MPKSRFACHPDELQAVLSETKEGSLWFVGFANAEILCGVYPERTAGILRFAQNDKRGARNGERRAQNDGVQTFFSSLLGRHFPT